MESDKHIQSHTGDVATASDGTGGRRSAEAGSQAQTGGGASASAGTGGAAKSSVTSQTPAAGKSIPAPISQALLLGIKDATDYAVAMLFASLFGETHRFIRDDEYWIFWTGKHWVADVKAQELHSDLRELRSRLVESRSLYSSPAIETIIHKLSQSRSTTAVIKYLSHEASLTLLSSDLDAYEHLIAFGNGVFNTDTAQVITAPDAIRPLYLLKRVRADYDAGAACPRWFEFLETIFCGDIDLIRYIQKAAGLSLSGKVLEERLFFTVGDGGNGKSTFFEALSKILGDYHQEIDSSILLKSKMSDQRMLLENIANLRGIRFATCNELPEKRAYNDIVVKQLSSRDQMTGKRIYNSVSSFAPSHKLWIRANHKPSFNVSDAAMLRRIVLIPFNHTFTEAERIERYEDLLLREKSGILLWLIEGWKLYRKEGLKQLPQSLATAMEDYKHECDTLEQFIEEKCVKMEGKRLPLSSFTNAYNEWAGVNGVGKSTSRRLGDEMRKNGYEVVKSGNTCVAGLVLVDHESSSS
ncbi:MAG: phage/plasmid primase, P4 family [Candidatus Cloacimonadaceae bacterium]|nr:phage/plasmid primase, P4 family [Candidatus Cloacimonadaceae bacterium]